MNLARNDPDKPSLLFISPVFPDVLGNGLAMRGGMFLETLSKCYFLDLLVVPIFDDPAKPVPDIVSRCCRHVAVIQPHLPAPGRPQGIRAFLSTRLFRAKRVERPWLWEYATRSAIEEASKAFKQAAYDAVHVFRLYMVPFAGPFLQGGGRNRPAVYLDIDDIESVTHARLAQAYQGNNEPLLALFEQEEGLRYQRAEDEILPQMDRVYVCSDFDRAELASRYPGLALHVIPNAVYLPPPLPHAQARDRLNILFVGTLGYYPNLDAVRYFCQEILPLIQQGSPRPVEFQIVGNGVGPVLEQLDRMPGVKLVGPVPSVTPHYQAADLVVAPLRTGGGTRIKVLEAFAHQRPLVSTTIGIEGINAEPGTDLLVGDSPEEFARACLRIQADSSLREKLIQNACSLVRSSYSMDVVRRIITALPLPPPCQLPG